MTRRGGTAVNEESVGRDLSALFDPRSVAVVGASDDESKYGNWLSVQALRMTGAREVHLVNHRGGAVLGHRVARRVQELAVPVDLAVLTVPASGFEAAVDDALEVGVRAVVAVTSGFAESGLAGRRVEERVVRRVREAGAVLVGPNCLGIFDASSQLTLTSNPMPSGRVALLSQSGNVALELSNSLAACGHGFSRFVSLGNQADLDVADLIEACAHHEGTGVIAVYCEDFRDGRRFAAAAAEAVRRGKPVVLLTVGGSEASIRGALSHTGSMTTRSAVVDAVCEAAGIYRVASPKELVSVAATVLRYGTTPVRRLAVVADGGGHASIASDLAGAGGLEVPAFGTALQARLADLLPTSVSPQNPVDVGSGSGLDIDSFCTVTGALLDDDAVDAVLVTGYFGGYEQYGASMARREVDAARRLGDLAATNVKPLLVHTMFPQGAAARTLTDVGVPVFAAADDATRCLSVLASRRGPREVPDALPPDAGPVVDAGYWGTRELLAAAGVDLSDARLVTGPDDAVAAGAQVGYPVVLKAMGLLHKSDVGGVVLGLTGPAELVAAVAAMAAALSPPAFSVEAMVDVSVGVELVVGAQADPRFGPVVTIGLGGVQAEVLDDVCHALAPVDEAAALALLPRLRGAAVLGPFRGRPALDLPAAARTVAAVSVLMASHQELAELEINPLLLTPHGAVALDARAVLQPSGPDEQTTREDHRCSSA